MLVRSDPYDVIPTALRFDRFGPGRGWDGSDAVWRFGEPVSGNTATVHNVRPSSSMDGVISVEHAVAELVGAEILPDVLDTVQPRAVRRQVQQGDVVRHAQTPAGYVPARAVADQHSRHRQLGGWPACGMLLRWPAGRRQRPLFPVTPVACFRLRSSAMPSGFTSVPRSACAW